MSRLPGFLLLLFAIVLCSGICEIALRVFLPMPFYTIGSDYVPNADLYGWGYAPNARILVSDPDTGMVYEDIANSGGWRDHEHAFAKPAGTKRILVLGDSNTFGANLPADNIYPHILEEMLKRDGFDVEVISLAYGGWSTAQELEALTLEGLGYKPDFVVMQFTMNDLGENAFRPSAEERDIVGPPFFYHLDDSGALSRGANPYFKKLVHAEKWAVVKHLLERSEILKRAYVLYNSLRHAQSRRPLFGYPLSSRQLEQAKLAFGVEDNEPLAAYLRSKLDQRLDPAELEKKIDASAFRNAKLGLMKVLSDAWINQYWDPSLYHFQAPIESSFEWRLYKALLIEARRRIPADVPMLVLSDQDQGYYDWSRSWHRIATDERTKRAFLEVNNMISRIDAEIELVPLKFPHSRFNLDPHPNKDGHRAMAMELYDYLLSKYRLRLQQ